MSQPYVYVQMPDPDIIVQHYNEDEDEPVNDRIYLALRIVLTFLIRRWILF